VAAKSIPFIDKVISAAEINSPTTMRSLIEMITPAENF
jgi:hypothetical protein